MGDIAPVAHGVGEAVGVRVGGMGDAKKIAVIGADADHNAIGGGTPFVLATEKTTPLDGITERAEAAGATVEWVEGNDPANGANMLESRDMTAVPSSVLSPNNGQGTGLDASFWRNNSFQGAPDEQRIARQVNYDVGILSTLDAPGPSQVPPPPVNCEKAGACSSGLTTTTAMTRKAIVPIFMNELR